MNSAINFLKSYFPHTNPRLLSNATHQQYQISVFYIPEFEHGNEIYFVMSYLENSEFIPKVVSEYSHIPYPQDLLKIRPSTFEKIGVYIFAELVHEPFAQKVRFQYLDAIHEREVVQSHAIMIIWDTVSIHSTLQPKMTEIFIDGAWQKTIIEGFGILPDTFYNVYKDYYSNPEKHKEPKFNWIYEAFLTSYSYNQKTQLLKCLVDRSQVNDLHMGYLAAGPFEGLLDNNLMDYIEQDLPNKEKWHTLFSMAYWHNEAPKLKERIKKYLG